MAPLRMSRERPTRPGSGGPNFAKRSPQIREDPLVELAGIEPASCGAVPGLLRVQFVIAIFSAPALPRTVCRRAQSGLSPDQPS